MQVIKEKLEIEETKKNYIVYTDNTTYLFFKKCKEVYINTLEQKVPLGYLENYIKLLRLLKNY